MEKLNNTIILRVSKADRERIRAKMDELGVMNMSATSVKWHWMATV